jgi:hypothetical protein
MRNNQKYLRQMQNLARQSGCLTFLLHLSCYFERAESNIAVRFLVTGW